MDFVKNYKAFCLTVALVVPLSGCNPLSERYSTTDDLLVKVGQTMQNQLPVDFAELKFDERSPDQDLTPTLSFTGKTSTILAVEKPIHRSDSMSYRWETVVQMQGLALTKNGRYFTFTYESRLLDPASVYFDKPCVGDGCQDFRDARSVSPSDAKVLFFKSEAYSPERFKELFGEDGPPKRVDA